MIESFFLVKFIIFWKELGSFKLIVIRYHDKRRRFFLGFIFIYTFVYLYHVGTLFDDPLVIFLRRLDTHEPI